MTYLILALLVISLLSILTAVFSIKSASKHKAEVKRLESKMTFLQAELGRRDKVHEIQKEISEEIHEIKKPLHSGTRVDRVNAATDIMRKFATGDNPDPDTPA